MCEARLQGQAHNRQEFEDKAKARGEIFTEQASSRLTIVKQGFDKYADCLKLIHQCAQAQDSSCLSRLHQQLEEATREVFAALDSYAGFYFSWGENQSPLVTMIRHAVETYSREALQSTQAQRILTEMQEQLSKEAGEA